MHVGKLVHLKNKFNKMIAQPVEVLGGRVTTGVSISFLVTDKIIGNLQAMFGLEGKGPRRTVLTDLQGLP